MQKLKICIVSQQYERVLSGVGIYTRNIIEAFCKDGHSVSLLCPISKDARFERKECELISIPGAKLPDYRLGWICLSYLFARKLREVQKRQNFDIVHFTDAREGLFYVFYAKKATCVVGNVNDFYIAIRSVNPLFYRKHYRTDWLKRWLYYNVVFQCERFTLPKMKAIICNSFFTMDIIKRKYTLSKEQLFVCYKSINPELYLKIGSSPDKYIKPQILFIGGGNMQRKGFTVLVEAASIVLKKIPNIQFLIIGRDINTKKIMCLCKEKGVQDRFQFLGWVPHNELVKYYKRASIFVMPSLIEAFGVVFLEAMASGTPVIGSNVGGTKELIKDGENGFLVAPGDSNDLAKKILIILQNEKIRNKFIISGKETVSKFTVTKMVTDTYEIYNRILNKTF
jgi:glycosyltransferase involved in cell wall biosynthesis